MGHAEDARRIAIEKQRRLRKSHQLTRRECFWNWLLGVTIAHGYRPWRPFMIALVVVGVGWCVFSGAEQAKIMVPTKADAHTSVGTPPQPRLRPSYPPFQSLLYSLDVFLPLVN
jgi:hypothetical protein